MEHSFAHACRGRVLAARGQPEEAEAAFEAAVIAATEGGCPFFAAVWDARAAARRGARPTDHAELVQLLGEQVCISLGLASSDAARHHPSSPLCYPLFQRVLHLARDPDTHIGHWVQHGAPMGIAKPIVPGGLFPLRPSNAEIDVGQLADQYEYKANHPSFDRCYGEFEPPTLPLIRGYLRKGFGKLFRSRRHAEVCLGATFPAPLGNIRKKKKQIGTKFEEI